MINLCSKNGPNRFKNGPNRVKNGPKKAIFIGFIYHIVLFLLFKGHFPYCFYQPTINQKPLTIQNDTDHLLTSAGAWPAKGKL